jgi:hypothetical protein
MLHRSISPVLQTILGPEMHGVSMEEGNCRIILFDLFKEDLKNLKHEYLWNEAAEF